MWKSVRRRYWAELAGAVVSAVLFVVTLVWPDWIELLFHVDADGGSGSLEWLIVGVSAVASLACGALARREWRRAAAAAAPGV